MTSDRRSTDALAVAAGRATPESIAPSTILGMTTSIAAPYPTNAASWYAIVPLAVDGTETEGAGATFTGLSSITASAFNLGASTPPSGTKVLCFMVGGRWVFRYDG